MKILLLDNYDSFVHNLARYFRRLGCDTNVVRSDQINVQEVIGLGVDGVVISPGPHGPADAGCSVELIKNAPSKLPILGVCLGHQSIGAAFGGRISQCDPMHGMASSITHDGMGVFAGCPSPMKVGRYHSLALEQDSVPNELLVTARSEDDGVIMGVRHRTRPLFGVQFHPESVLSDEGLNILSNFADIAGTRCKSESAFDEQGRSRLDQDSAGPGSSLRPETGHGQSLQEPPIGGPVGAGALTGRTLTGRRFGSIEDAAS